MAFFTFNEFVKIIQNELIQGNRKFIICPLNEHAMEGIRILDVCFGIKPVYVADDVINKANEDVKNLDYINRHYENERVLIFAEGVQYKRILNSLSRFIPISRMNVILRSVHKIRTMKYSNSVSINKDASIEKLLPCYEKKQELKSSKKTIKVRFICWTLRGWRSLSTPCESFERDDEYDVLAILMRPTLEPQEETMKNSGIKYTFFSNYSPEQDRPNIVVADGFWDSTGYRDSAKVNRISKYADMVVCIYAILTRITIGKAESEMYGWMVQHAALNPDRYIVSPAWFYQLNEDFIRQENVICMDDPKMDLSFRTMGLLEKTEVMEKKFKKLMGKKIVSYITTHGVNGNNMTFDIYLHPLLEFAQSHSNLGIVVRFHPQLITEIVNAKIWSEYTIEEVKRYFDEADNIIWDDYAKFEEVYSISDAIITEQMTGVYVSALPTGKPICILKREGWDSGVDTEIRDSLYSASDSDEMMHFLQMVLCGEDPKRNKREEICRKYIRHFDGKNGERVKGIISNEYKNNH